MKVCTKPMSCEFDIKSVTYLQMAQSRAEHLSTPKKEFDLKSVTNSQMAKRRAEHLSPPKKRLQTHSSHIWKSGTLYWAGQTVGWMADQTSSSIIELP